MRGLFAEVTILFVIFCCNFDKSSQYGGDLMPSRTTEKYPVNGSEEHVNMPHASMLLSVKTDTENNQLLLVMDERTQHYFNVSVECFYGNKVIIYVSVADSFEVLQITGNHNFTFICGLNSSYEQNEIRTTHTELLKSQHQFGFLNETMTMQKSIYLTLDSHMIGTSSLIFEVIDLESDTLSTNISAKIDVVVIRNLLAIDIAFLVTVYVLEILEMLTFGTQLDLDTVRHTLKTPLPLVIGLLCQYLGMPLISFSIAKAVASDSLTAIGIFVAGVCPGGGSSNIYTYLLDGDLSLSITMTAISTVMSLAMLPLWLYTLGSEFLQANDLDIPYSDIIVTLSVMLVPLAVGLLIRNKFPKVTDLIDKVMNAILTILALILITTGVISSLYLFKMFNLTIIIIGCILPYVGFCLGAVISLILRQPKKTAMTIAIETGMQNTGIAIILLLNSFPAPFGDISTVAPVSAEVMSPIPPFLASIVYIIWKSCCQKYKKAKLTESDEEMSTEQSEIDKEHSEIDKEHSEIDKEHSEIDKEHSEIDKEHSEIDKEHSEIDKEREYDDTSQITTGTADENDDHTSALVT